MTNKGNCPLCAHRLPGEILRTNQWAIVDAQEPLFPGFTRVVWLDHVAEMTDLQEADRLSLMQVVFEVENLMRQMLRPDKVNLACLGNQVPHLHWHIIARWRDDAAFPASVWGPARPSAASQDRQQSIQRLLTDYHRALKQRFITDSS
jgi:diadenosine tetraphosphate (Ap4A) HIT family hydrolase